MSAWDRAGQRATEATTATGPRPPTLCEICREEISTSSKRRRHLTCCAAAGGRPDDICNQIRARVDDAKDKVDVCAHCWVRAA